jgi:hypothetical protein
MHMSATISHSGGMFVDKEFHSRLSAGAGDETEGTACQCMSNGMTDAASRRSQETSGSR